MRLTNETKKMFFSFEPAEINEMGEMFFVYFSLEM